MHQFSVFGAYLQDFALCRGRDVTNWFGYALERTNIVSLDLCVATITDNETFSATSFACREASGTIALIGFMSLEKLHDRTGEHGCYLRMVWSIDQYVLLARSQHHVVFGFGEIINTYMA
jgi:hypothetical protein